MFFVLPAVPALVEIGEVFIAGALLGRRIIDAVTSDRR